MSLDDFGALHQFPNGRRHNVGVKRPTPAENVRQIACPGILRARIDAFVRRGRDGCKPVVRGAERARELQKRVIGGLESVGHKRGIAKRFLFSLAKCDFRVWFSTLRARLVELSHPLEFAS